MSRLIRITVGHKVASEVLAERLGFHVTTGELDIWKDRWTNGVSGDTFLNARITDEKNRVTNNKNSFVSNPGDSLWEIPVKTDSDGYQTDGNQGVIRPKAARIRDAAFWALVNSDASVMATVRDTFAQQPDQTGCNNIYTEKPWGTGGTNFRNASDPHFSVTHAYVCAVFTYDYVNIAVQLGLIGDFTSAQHTKIRGWFDRWGEICAWRPEWRANLRFEDWTNENYTVTSSGSSTCAGACNNTPVNYPPGSYFEESLSGTPGPEIKHMMEPWDNRTCSLVRMGVLSSLITGDTTRRDKMSRFVRDWVRYSVWPQGFYVDIHRGSNNQYEGLGYQSLILAHMMNCADVLGRAGFMEALAETTTVGAEGTEGAPSTVGGGAETDKTMGYGAKSLARYGNYTWNRVSVQSGNRFDWHTAPASHRGKLFDRIIAGNLYYQSSLVEAAYRGGGDFPDWIVNGNGTSDLNDAWAYAAPYLMWAGLEGVVDPYGGS